MSPHRPPTVLVVHPDLRMMGGGEMVLLLALRALRAPTADARLASSPIADPTLAAEFRSAGLRPAPDLPMRPPPTGFASVYRSLWRLRRDLQALASTQSDAVLLTQDLLPDLAWAGRARVVLYVHYPSLRAHEAHANGWASWYLRPARRTLERQLRRVDAIVTNSQFTRDAVREAWGPLGVPEPAVVPPATTRTFRADRPWRSRAARVLYVARLTRSKRHDALRDLAVRQPKAEFVSCGSSVPAYDGYRTELGRKAPGNYRIVPNANPPTLRDLLESSRVYVHPAVDEHFGVSVLEAMKAGCVPLVHDSGGARSLVPPELRWRDAEGLNLLVDRFLWDENAWRRAHAAVVRGAAAYTPSTFARGLLEVAGFARRSQSS